MSRPGLACCALLAAAGLARAAQEAGAPAVRAEPAAPAAEGEPAAQARDAAPTVSTDDARSARRKALGYLVARQNPDGSWAGGTLEALFEDGFALETFYAWQMASQALACMALAAAEDTPERRAALERGVDWLCDSRLPKRGDDWDIDYAWTALFGFVGAVELSQDPRFAAAPSATETTGATGAAGAEPTKSRAERLKARGHEFYALLEKLESIDGGWGYYDDPPYPSRPVWATSFSTACVIPALVRARELGWEVDPALIARAVDYVQRCRVPGGAYTYDWKPVPTFVGESIASIKGSLGRTQVCNWALHGAGVRSITPERLREGLVAFFEHHVFLDVARRKPIPHEAYYYNSGYFYYFGHYYAARVVELLPEEERAAWHAKLRWHVIKAQREDGSCDDFVAGGWSEVAGTAFAALALSEGL